MISPDGLPFQLQATGLSKEQILLLEQLSNEGIV
jgi:hypothetical protein